MRTYYLFIWLLMMAPVLSLAQTRQPDCREMVNTGDRLLNTADPDLDQVLTEYLSALNCDASLAGELGPKI